MKTTMKRILAAIVSCAAASLLLHTAAVSAAEQEPPADLLAGAPTAEDSAPEITASGEIGEALTWTLDSGGSMVVSGTGEIPEFPPGHSPWLEIKDSVRFVLVDQGVTALNGSFNAFTNLEEAVLTDTVVKIAAHTFEMCPNLRIVRIENPDCEIEDHPSAISNTATIYCSTVHSAAAQYAEQYQLGFVAEDGGKCGENLTWSLDGDTLTISGTGEMNFARPDGPPEAPWSAAKERIAKVVIEDGAQNIDNRAFAECTSLTGIVIPDSVTSIGERAFYNCTNLAQLDIPASVDTVGPGAFDGTAWLANNENPLITVNSTLIDGHNCTGDVVIPDGIRLITRGAFSGNENITSVKISDSVTRIDDFAFENCTNLASVELPEDLTDLGGGIFKGTAWLRAKQTEDPTVVVNGVLIDGTACTGDVFIPETVSIIGTFAFSDCAEITTVYIPDSVGVIGWGAFTGCTELLGVTMADSVLEIMPAAFSECPKLTTVSFSCALGSIGWNLFGGCTALRDLYLPESVTAINGEAFTGCTLSWVVILNPDCEIMGPDPFGDAEIVSYAGGTLEQWAAENQKQFTALVPETDRVLIGAQCSGLGQIAGTDDGTAPVFDDEYPYQSVYFNQERGITVTLAAKAFEGWQFVKWQNARTGANYSYSETITLTAEEELALVAVFKPADATEEGHITTDDELEQWAAKDYQERTGQFAVARITGWNDDFYCISLFSEEGDLLDTYTVDTMTGIGSSDTEETVNLPQTGTSGRDKALTGAAALLILTGFALMKRSRKEENA